MLNFGAQDASRHNSYSHTLSLARETVEKYYGTRSTTFGTREFLVDSIGFTCYSQSYHKTRSCCLVFRWITALLRVEK